MRRHGKPSTVDLSESQNSGARMHAWQETRRRRTSPELRDAYKKKRWPLEQSRSFLAEKSGNKLVTGH